jgi:hypothetical protein
LPRRSWPHLFRVDLAVETRRHEQDGSREQMAT